MCSLRSNPPWSLPTATLHTLFVMLLPSLPLHPDDAEPGRAQQAVHVGKTCFLRRDPLSQYAIRPLVQLPQRSEEGRAQGLWMILIAKYNISFSRIKVFCLLRHKLYFAFHKKRTVR